jgi:hypothetical protein
LRSVERGRPGCSRLTASALAAAIPHMRNLGGLYSAWRTHVAPDRTVWHSAYYGVRTGVNRPRRSRCELPDYYCHTSVVAGFPPSRSLTLSQVRLLFIVCTVSARYTGTASWGSTGSQPVSPLSMLHLIPATQPERKASQQHPRGDDTFIIQQI